jgi:hypothetical protein
VLPRHPGLATTFPLLLLALVSPAVAGPAPAGDGGSSPGELPADLGPLLASRAAVYEEKTLGFQCLETAYREKIREDGTAREKVRERRYLLEREETGAVYRALRGKPGGGKLSDKSPFPVPEPFAWTQLFDTTLRTNFHFEVGEPTEIAERKAVPIRFESSQPPEDGRSIKEWSGIAWVDARRGDLLRVAARPNFQDDTLEEAYRTWARSTRIRVWALTFKKAPTPRGREVEVDFGQLHDDLLYPSRGTLVVFRMTGPSRRVRESRTLVEYSEYEFFKAEAELHGSDSEP